MDVKGCIFDLDGVIVDTAKYHFLAWKKLADQLSIRFTENDNEKLKGVSRLDSLEIILGIGKLHLTGEMKRKYAQLKNEWYVGYISRITPDEILPGSLEFINELKAAGIRTALGSASKNTPMILERLGMKNMFDAVADGNTVKRAKPDPEVFLTAARMISVNPGDCVVFEDAVAGVRAALSAGMTCVGIGSDRILKEAHYIVSGLNEMNLEKLNKIHGRR
ncbi:MAG: beta-phosphoglucomutase [Bacteroidota bacterium]